MVGTVASSSQTMCSGVCIVCHRAGELSAQELEQLMVIVSNPRTFKVWVLSAPPAPAAQRVQQRSLALVSTQQHVL